MKWFLPVLLASSLAQAGYFLTGPTNGVYTLDADPDLPQCSEPVEISGVVKDLQGKALQGTEVFFRNKSVAMTGTDGTYAVRFVGNAAELTGSKIRFSKLLFKAAVAEALTESELTRSSCTKVLLTRDAVLKPLR